MAWGRAAKSLFRSARAASSTFSRTSAISSSWTERGVPWPRRLAPGQEGGKPAATAQPPAETGGKKTSKTASKKKAAKKKAAKKSARKKSARKN